MNITNLAIRHLTDKGYQVIPPPPESSEMVFVVGDEPDEYKRIPLCEARRKSIIRCRLCGKAAVTIDGLWPYHNDYNLCANHRNRTP